MHEGEQYFINSPDEVLDPRSWGVRGMTTHRLGSVDDPLVGAFLVYVNDGWIHLHEIAVPLQTEEGMWRRISSSAVGAPIMKTNQPEGEDQ